MAKKQVDGDFTPLLGNDIGAEESVARPDQRAYVPWGVISTGHRFTAPKDKYKDIKDILGLKELDSNNDGQVDDEQGDTNIDVGGALQGLTGVGAQDTRNDFKSRNSFLYYVKLRVKAESGYLSVICDPEKLSTALQGLEGKNIYGKKILSVSFPKQRIFNG